MKSQKNYLLRFIPVHALMFLGVIDGHVQKQPLSMRTHLLKN
nr:MAG TPA: hypothetical protein [Caudoviricetes sp.]